MSDTIPMLDLGAEVRELWPELERELKRVMESARFILGPEVSDFESKVAEYIGVEHAIGVASGSDALVLALDALGVGPGDEVLTTPFTYVATAASALRVGAVPVFVDVDPMTFNLDLDAVERAITPATKAIVPVHLFGHGVDMHRLGQLVAGRQIHVLEDVAQALGGSWKGQKLGSFGAAAAYSFFPSKNLGAYGDGGLVTCADAAVAERVRMLRAHGARKKYFNEVLGYNSRLDALQAAILNVKLPRLDESVAARNRVAARYAEGLAACEQVRTPSVSAEARHAFHQYTVRVPAEARDKLKAHLGDRGVSSMVYYPVLLPDMPLFERFGGDFPVARLATREVLSLPIWPGMPDGQQDRVIASLLEFFD